MRVAHTSIVVVERVDSVHSRVRPSVQPRLARAPTGCCVLRRGRGVRGGELARQHPDRVAHQPPHADAARGAWRSARWQCVRPPAAPAHKARGPCLAVRASPLGLSAKHPSGDGPRGHPQRQWRARHSSPPFRWRSCRTPSRSTLEDCTLRGPRSAAAARRCSTPLPRGPPTTRRWSQTRW